MPFMVRLGAFVAAFGLSVPAGAADGASFASHCLAGEVTVFSSRMGTSVWNDMRTRKKLKGDKVLSLCADKFPAAKRIAMRFGKPGVAELDVSSATAPARLSVQQLEGGETWTALSFQHNGLDWTMVQPEGGDARDVFLIVRRDTEVLARTEAIDEGEHWLLIKKKFGKKKMREVPAMLADIPATVSPRSRTSLDPIKVNDARYAANLTLPK